MTDPARTLILSLLAVLWFSGSAVAVDDENWQRLRSTPRQRRLELSSKLEQFDSLDREQKSAIRELDRSVSSLPQTDRVNCYATLHRYHLWLQGLPEAQRNEINAATPDKRMSVVSRVMNEQASQGSTTPLFVRLSDIGGVSPFELANRIKIWHELSPAQKSELNRMQDLNHRLRRLKDFGSRLKVEPIPQPTMPDEEKTLERLLKRPAFAMLRHNDVLLKQLNAKQLLPELVYFLDNPPAPVKPENLVRFGRELPVWVRSHFDPLPPDEARRRLTILYRLIYPRPQEFKEQTPAATAPAPPSPKPAPSTSKSATNPTPY
jgi:hypothetical protein